MILILLLSLIAILYSWHIAKHFILPKLTNEPPVISGLIPFVGCAIQFGKATPVKFLKICENKYGDTFTLHLAGRNMTFLLNPEDFPQFFSSDEEVVDFQYATQPFLSRCFGVPKQVYFDYHEKLLHIVRTSLFAKNMDNFIAGMCHSFEEHLKTHWGGASSEKGMEIQLLESIHELNFNATLTALFGEKFQDYFAKNPVISGAFKKFDGWFEIASSTVPHLFLTIFTNSKKHLLKCTKALADEYPDAPTHSPPLTGELMRQELGREGLENWLLAMMWAGEANAIPTLFWCIIYFIRNPDYLQRVLSQIDEVVRDRDLTEVSFKELSQMNLIRNAINETIRLHSPPIIVRAARKPVKVSKYTIPTGNFICLSPFWSHRNPSLYSDPLTWNPDRWEEIDLVTKHKYSFLAFGSGKYRCPGQSFAYLGLTLEITILLSKFQFYFVDPNQNVEMDLNNLVGSTKPLKDAHLIVKSRK